MSLALEHYRALLQEKKLPESMETEDAARLLREVVTTTQQLTLSQLPSSNARQLGSILFSHEAGLVSALSTMNPPEIGRTEKNTPKQKLLMLGLSALLGLGALYFMWHAGEIIPALFVVAALGLAGYAFFAPAAKEKVTLRQSVNSDALFSLAERRMEAIDRDLDAFLSIPTDSGDGDDSIVQLIQLANKLKMQDADSVPDELMTSITALSIGKGYDFLDYTEETEGCFDTMPTKRETRTIVPAVTKNGTLIARGMAIVQMEREAEDN